MLKGGIAVGYVVVYRGTSQRVAAEKFERSKLC